MKYFDWNADKNELLKVERSISFEDVSTAIHEQGLLAVIDHPNKQKYPGQKIFVVCVEEYVYLVPFVEDEEKIFFNTIIPSRKYTKVYLQSKHNKKSV